MTFSGPRPSLFRRQTHALLVGALILGGLSPLNEAIASKRSCVTKIVARASVKRPIPPRFEAYYVDTLSGLEWMRNPETGLVRDKIRILPKQSIRKSIIVLNDLTSPTNVALDMMIQIDLLRNPAKRNVARKTLDQILSSLERLEFHHDTGLFFSWFSTGKDLKITSHDVSSVDNLHLALALWTVKETIPGTPLAEKATTLFNRMDFSVFWDPKMAQVGGNLKHEGSRWKLEKYRFGIVGTEARSIYSVGYALGLFKNIQEPRFVERSVASLGAEFSRGPKSMPGSRILRTWDGGAFQIYLPRVLVNEDRYSTQLRETFNALPAFMVEEGKRQNYSLPAAHSASSFGVDRTDLFPGIPDYMGNSGNPALVFSWNKRVGLPKYSRYWDLVYTPHAAFLAATANPEEMAPGLVAAEKMKSGEDPLYRPDLGFMDGMHLRGTYRNRVVPVQLSLDQEMIALSLIQLRSADGMTPSSRALMNNPVTRGRLTEFFRLMDQKLETIPTSP